MTGFFRITVLCQKLKHNLQGQDECSRLIAYTTVLERKTESIYMYKMYFPSYVSVNIVKCNDFTLLILVITLSVQT